MTIPAFWQQAWDLAEPRLTTIRTSLEGTARGPEARNLRVGQLDSELLDQELLQLLREPIYKSLDILNVRFIRLESAQTNVEPGLTLYLCTFQRQWRTRFEPELTLLLQTILYKYSIWDSDASYGAKLQSLQYTTYSSSGLLARASVLINKIQREKNMLMRDQRLDYPGTSSSPTQR